MSELSAIKKIRSVLAKHRETLDSTATQADTRILTTGGTMDKVHDPVTEKLIFKANTHLSDMLAEAFVNHAIVEQIMMKDSLDMTDEDRRIIHRAVLDTPEEQIVITHGTSTMEITARYLEEQGVGDKIVVMTGAFRPYSLSHSDAKFNLGTALAAVQILLPGVYIAMNGKVFAASNVTKNVAACRFELLETEE